MSKRFSSEQLYKLRNEIPLDVVIKDLLCIPSKISEGYFKFLCPECNEFVAAVNPNTNLSRCFRCKINFNSIELVMKVENKSFVEAVKRLQLFVSHAPKPH